MISKMMIVKSLFLLVLLGINNTFALDSLTGQEAYAKGHSLYDVGEYEEASKYLWKAVRSKKTGDAFTVEQAMSFFLQSYKQRDRLGEGYAFMASEYVVDNNIEAALQLAKQAIIHDPENEGALEILELFGGPNPSKSVGQRSYELGIKIFNLSEYEEAADKFWESIMLKQPDDQYDVSEAYSKFVECYEKQDNLIGAFIRLSHEYLKEGNLKPAYLYAKRAHEIDPENKEVSDIMETLKASNVQIEGLTQTLKGQEAYDKASSQFQLGEYERAAKNFWAAVMTKQPTDNYDITSTFNSFLECYHEMNDIAGGYVFVASEYVKRSGKEKQAFKYALKALNEDPDNEIAKSIVEKFPEIKAEFSGQETFDKAISLYMDEEYENAAAEFWRAAVKRKVIDSYEYNDSIDRAIECYAQMDRGSYGLSFVATKFAEMGIVDQAKIYATRALVEDPENAEAQEIIGRYKAQSVPTPKPFEMPSLYPRQIDDSFT